MNATATSQISFPQEGYYLYMDGKNLGPMTQEQILDQYSKGHLPRNTPLWFQGLANWITVADMPELDRRQVGVGDAIVPEKDRPDAIVVKVKNHAMPLQPQSVKALIASEDLRRTDMVYEDSSKSWVRADQHSITKLFYTMPSTPSAPTQPLAVVGGVTSPTVKTVTNALAAGTKIKEAPAKGDATDGDTRGRWILWLGVIVFLGAGVYYGLHYLGKI